MLLKTLTVALLMVALLATPAECWWRRRRRRSPPPACPSIPASSYRSQSCTNNCYVGSTCTFSCRAGYQLSGTSQTTCQSSCLWSPATFPTCQAITCSPCLTSPANGHVTCTNTNQYNSVCTYTCNSGYRIAPGGSQTRRCDASGCWTGTTPTCMEIRETCPAIPWESHCWHACTDSSYVGSTCTFHCQEGYNLVGVAQTTCSTSCGWTEEFPTCEDQPCSPRMVGTRNGYVSCTNDNEFNSVCTFGCNYGYTLGGDTPTCTCTASGWSGRAPACTPWRPGGLHAVKK